MKTIEELQKEYQIKFDQEIEEISKLETVDELKEKEQEVIKKFKEYDEHIKTVSYQLPDTLIITPEMSGDANDVEYTKEDVLSMIVEFICSKEIEWKFTRGTFELCRDLKRLIESGEGINYHLYDSTIQLLTSAKYTGEQEYYQAMVIGRYMNVEGIGYYADSLEFSYLSNIHNQILQKMQSLETLNEPI